ncbi:MAG: hypothetical protein HY535_08785 [Chloroflexi bacterium]|nr:hypothetical protein [Chloroflexota bacterium]
MAIHPVLAGAVARPWVWAFGLSLAALTAGSSVPAVLFAQEPPPFPILYAGWAHVDGEPLPEGSRLVARVKDYEIWTTVEKDGFYRNLVVGPPSKEYYGQTITFHALGLAAQEQDVFLTADGPVFKVPPRPFNLRFPRSGGPATPEATQVSPTGVTPAAPETGPAGPLAVVPVTAAVALVALGALGVGLAVRRARGRGRAPQAPTPGSRRRGRERP